MGRREQGANTTHEGNGRSTLLLHVDSNRPDWRMRYVGDTLESREELSGRVMVRIAPAAIAGGVDPPWAGDIDP